MALPKEVEAAMAAHLDPPRYALPWQVETPYLVARMKGEDTKITFAAFERKDVRGKRIAYVEQRGSTYFHELCVEGARRELVESETLADALADADTKLETQGWQIVGRVVWT